MSYYLHQLCTPLAKRRYLILKTKFLLVDTILHGKQISKLANVWACCSPIYVHCSGRKSFGNKLKANGSVVNIWRLSPRWPIFSHFEITRIELHQGNKLGNGNLFTRYLLVTLEWVKWNDPRHVPQLSSKGIFSSDYITEQKFRSWGGSNGRTRLDAFVFKRTGASLVSC